MPCPYRCHADIPMLEDDSFNPLGPFPALPEMGYEGFNNHGTMPGVLCSKCAAAGIETWVIEGKMCPECDNPC